MREAELNIEIRTLERSTITNADELKLLGVTLGNTDDHVVDERAGKTVKALSLTGIVRALDDDLIVFDLDGEHIVELTRQFAFATLDGHDRTVDLDLNAGRNGDRHLTDTRH